LIGLSYRIGAPRPSDRQETFMSKHVNAGSLLRQRCWPAHRHHVLLCHAAIAGGQCTRRTSASLS